MNTKLYHRPQTAKALTIDIVTHQSSVDWFKHGETITVPKNQSSKENICNELMMMENRKKEIYQDKIQKIKERNKVTT